MTIKWTHQLRCEIYSNLKNDFGTVENWKASTVPTREAFYEKMRLRLLEIVNEPEIELSDLAVKQQIEWGIITKQPSINEAGFVRNWILNKAAAIETGLINSGDLPEILLVQY
jgi:hypothetical protein